MGRALCAALCARGDRPVIVSRDAGRARSTLARSLRDVDADAYEVVEGDPVLAGPWQQALSGIDGIVNLAGQSVAGERWSSRYKQLIHDSRVETTRYVVEGVAALDEADRPKVLVSASGIDYYPFDVDLGAALAVDEDDAVDESVPPGSTFLARVCRNWEAEAKEAEALGLRVATLRTSVVLGHGGPLDKMAGPFRLFVGGRIGHGRQWLSWVHLDDAVNAYLFALDRDEVKGPLNLVAPETTRAGAFAKALGKALGRPSWLPVPGFALRAAVGEFSEHLLNGRRAVPAALQAYGFEFQYPELAGALAEVYGR